MPEGNLTWLLQSFRGLHGVGVSVVNALSEKLELKIFLDGKEYVISFQNGNTLKSLKQIGKTKKKATRINFSFERHFSSIKFSSSILEKKIIRELAFLNKGVCISLIGSFLQKR